MPLGGIRPTQATLATGAGASGTARACRRSCRRVMLHARPAGTRPARRRASPPRPPARSSAVDDDLVDRVDALGQRGLDQAAQRRAVGVVGAGLELLVAAADLAAAADDAAGERQDDAGHLRMAATAASAAARPSAWLAPRIRKLPPATPLTVPKTSSQMNSPSIDRQPPVAPAFELLAELEAVAEEAQVAADADGLVLDDRQAVVAGGGRAGEDALADAVDDGLLQARRG